MASGAGEEVEAEAAGMPGEAAGDVEQPVAQPFRLAAGELALGEEEPLRPASRSCPIKTSSSQAAFGWNSRKGRLRRPASLP